MKVHITLVGGQPAPVYHGIVATQPDKIVFVYSGESRDIAERISEEVKIPSERRKMDPVDLNDIEKKVNQCAEQFRNDEVSVNISSGTKPWAFYFAKIFGALPNATLFYVDQNNMLWDFSDKTSRKVDFDMDAQFRLRGNQLKDYKCFDSYNDADKACAQQIEKLRAHSFAEFNELVNYLAKHQNHTEYCTANGSQLQWGKEFKEFRCRIRNGRGQVMDMTLKSPHLRQLLINSGWFEYKVAGLLALWDKVSDIRLNCKFPASNNAPKNEIDIILNAGGKLLFVECKIQIHEVTDIDKFTAAVKNYGGMGCKALFVTNASMNVLAQEKCKDNGILSFSLQDDHLGLSPEKALSLLLDSELFNINTK